jgi:hypothetical protein
MPVGFHEHDSRKCRGQIGCVALARPKGRTGEQPPLHLAAAMCFRVCRPLQRAGVYFFREIVIEHFAAFLVNLTAIFPGREMWRGGCLLTNTSRKMSLPALQPVLPPGLVVKGHSSGLPLIQSPPRNSAILWYAKPRPTLIIPAIKYSLHHHHHHQVQATRATHDHDVLHYGARCREPDFRGFLPCRAH